MTTWVIEPRDPLIVRDGRPFGPQPGARARSLRFPFPSTTTGGARTREGLNKDGIFGPEQANDLMAEVVDRVRAIGVRGPMLVELDEDGEIARWLTPAPADALLLEQLAGTGGDKQGRASVAPAPAPPDAGATDRKARRKKTAMRRRLTPLTGYDGARYGGLDGLDLVGLASPDPRKPCRDAPSYWYWSALEQWLRTPVEGAVAFADLGHDGPKAESRMHVRIDPATGTSVEGALFQTGGLEFARKGRSPGLGETLRLGLAIETDATKITPGMAPLAGERRIVAWRQSARPFPYCPNEIRAAILASGHCRLVLLTAACFTEGARPTWLCDPAATGGAKASLAALACGGYQVVSGWDLAAGKEGQPKPTRRLVPAGSVLYLCLEGDKQQIETWIDATWMRCVSDKAHDRLDGFGLAALGVWDWGNPQMVEDMQMEDAAHATAAGD